MAAIASALLVAALLMTHAADAAAQNTAEPIRYTLSFPAPHTHYMEVEAVVPTGRRADVELMMAVWTPGSYLVREYERNVEAVTAADGARVLAVEKTRKNRWRVTTGGAAVVTLRYRVFCHEMSVRTNWVESAFALVNGAPTFLTLADGVVRPHEVTIQPAAGWARSITSLPDLPGAAHRYRADDYDTLVDSPILIGNPGVQQFDVEGKTHYLATVGDGGVFDGPRAAADVEKIVREHGRMWGMFPPGKYVFINLLMLTAQGGGALEHKNSVVLMDGRFATRTRRAYLQWLELVSHEYFHAWNVKRLRPVELGPFDYEQENHTRSLWIAEGVTEYYGALLLHRAGLSTREEYLQELTSKIEELQAVPGRLVQPLSLASYDAWVKFYRPDENSVNAAVSYYTKGALVGLLLDANIRSATGGVGTLDEVMRAAYRQYAGARGYTPEQFRAVAEQVAGTSMAGFWAAYVDGVAELDYAGVLDTFGLHFTPLPAAPDGGRAWWGASTRNDAGRLIVTQVRRGTPAWDAGLNVEDEVLAIGDFRVRADRLEARLEQYRPGETVSVLVARREQLLRVDLTFGPEPPKRWRLGELASRTPAQTRQLATWLNH